MASDEIRILDKCYGKSWVKLLHVKRDGKVHTIQEYEVDTSLTLATEKDYLHGDNSDIIATDSQKNTVYLLAKRYGVSTPEQFAMLVCQHFLDKYPWVVKARVHVEKHPWKRIPSEDGREHNHAFISSPAVGTRWATVEQSRSGSPVVTSGLKDLRVLKTTQSAFVNFVDDEYRSLPDMDDRVFSTIVEASWRYRTTNGVRFCQTYNKVRQSILDLFAGNPDTGLFSASVQETMYLTQKKVLEAIPQIDWVQMKMPNKHYFTIDLSKFPRVGSATNNEVFLPVDKPSGMIEATVGRKNLRARL